jgi:hypothetical protein
MGRIRAEKACRLSDFISLLNLGGMEKSQGALYDGGSRAWIV